MTAKTFLIFGCGKNMLLKHLLEKQVVELFAKKGKIVEPFDEKKHIRPTKLLMVEKSIFLDVYILRKLDGKPVLVLKI